MLLAFIALAVPLVQLTSAVGAVDIIATKGVKESKEVTTRVVVRWAHKPAKLSLKSGNKELLTAIAEDPMETEVQLLIPKEGIELQAEAEWPAGTPNTALTIDLEPDSLESQSQTRWSVDGKLSEIIVYQWKL